MPPTLEPHEVERILRQMPLAEAPDGLWDDIRAELGRPEQTRQLPLLRRPVRSPLLAAAAALVALIGGTYVGVLRTYDAPSRWQVLPLAGAPTVAGASLVEPSNLEAGEWLVTDSLSHAQLAVGRIGTAHIGPNSLVRLDPARRTEHRLTLERGSLAAVITAPPRLFFVETPSALATDLGCVYTLEVDSAGTSRIHVTAGWVELKQGHRISLVPAGLIAEVEVGGGPGTPYPEGFPLDAQDALYRLDRGAGSTADLELVVSALHPSSAFVTLRQQSAITLWHLLQRLDGDLRDRAYEHLAALSAPPAGVTREGILALERPMLERWRRDINPMWSEEANPLVIRAARRLWEWAMR
jgi:hypothetical protein